MSWYAQAAIEVQGLLERMGDNPSGSAVVKAGSVEQAALVALLDGFPRIYIAGKHLEQAFAQLASLEGPVE